MTDINQTYDDFLRGRSISDEDLIAAYKHFRAAASLLIKMGERFSFAHNEACRVGWALHDYIIARGLGDKIK